MYASTETSDKVAAKARLMIPPSLCHVIAAEVHVEFLLEGINKATALAVVLKEWGVDWDECAFFGDNNNDIEALKLAGASYAMPNGRDAAKDVARTVCRGSNAEGGFAIEVRSLLRENVLCAAPYGVRLELPGV